MNHLNHMAKCERAATLTIAGARTAHSRAFRIATIIVVCAFAMPGMTQDAAPCAHISVHSQQPGSAIFFGGFESGSLDPWGTDAVFRTTEVLDLELAISFDTPITGEHVLELELYTPNGHLYQQLSAPISGDEERAGGSMRVPGYPRPLPILTAQAVETREADKAAYMLSLPVAGSSISRSALHGRWQIMGRLDGESISCDGPEAFVIVE